MKAESCSPSSGTTVQQVQGGEVKFFKSKEERSIGSSSFSSFVWLRLVRLCWGVEVLPASLDKPCSLVIVTSISSPVIPPKINWCSMADLVKQVMLKEVELQLTAMHELLLGALARITCLDKELTIYKADCSVPRLHSQSSSSSQL